jgi:heme/copper-type cytochrome/quinol oxidase subunit 2
MRAKRAGGVAHVVQYMWAAVYSAWLRLQALSEQGCTQVNHCCVPVAGPVTLELGSDTILPLTDLTFLLF